MKSSKRNTPPGYPSFAYIDRLFSSRLFTFSSSEDTRVARLFQAARAFNSPSCCFSRSAPLIRQNKLRNSLQSEVRFAESRTATAYGFLISSFFRMQMPERCLAGVSTGIYADRYRCGGKDASVTSCELKQRRMENDNGL